MWFKSGCRFLSERPSSFWSKDLPTFELWMVYFESYETVHFEPSTLNRPLWDRPLWPSEWKRAWQNRSLDLTLVPASWSLEAFRISFIRWSWRLKWLTLAETKLNSLSLSCQKLSTHLPSLSRGHSRPHRLSRLCRITYPSISITSMSLTNIGDEICWWQSLPIILSIWPHQWHHTTKLTLGQ